jgi:tetratricopeptide (TPR) repeat protein
MASTPSAPPLRPSSTADETLRRLRAEVNAAHDASRRARLLSEMAEVEERSGDDGAAARDYIAAFEADPSFREPLEGVARLIERRSSLRGLGRFFFDALIEASVTPEERVRALLLHAAHLADVAEDLSFAQKRAREATAVEGAPAAELGSAWLMLELLSAQTGDTQARRQAMTERSRFAGDSEWRALLLLDRARAAVSEANTEGALALLEDAGKPESAAAWSIASLFEQVVRNRPGVGRAPEDRDRTEQHAGALEALAGLVHAAITDPGRGNALGVPLWVRAPERAVDGWLRAAEERRALGQIDAAVGALNRALFVVDRMTGTDGRLAEAAVSQARIRLAEQIGDTGLAAQLAARRLSEGEQGPHGAAFALRIAEHAAAAGDAQEAVDAVALAVANDPGCLPARALQLDILADGTDASAFASQLEAFADHLSTDEARGRLFLLAAYVWAIRGEDVAGAKAALSQAVMFGTSPETAARLGRTLASIVGDAGWYEESTKRLVGAGAPESEVTSLYAELIRLRWARRDWDGASKALHDLGEVPGGAWLASVLEAFGRGDEHFVSPGVDEAAARARTAVEKLAENESDPDLARALGFVVAMRSHAAGDRVGARRQLHKLCERYPDDAVAATYAADLARQDGDFGAIAQIAAATAIATSDGELAAALQLESAFEQWRAGRKQMAIDALEVAIDYAPQAARMALGWAAWAVDPDSLDARAGAIDRADWGGGESRGLALERFATALGANDTAAAASALSSFGEAPPGSLSLAAALARLIAPVSASSGAALDDAIARIGGQGPAGFELAAAERVRVARDADDPEAIARAARTWFEAGGGLPAAIEWLAATTVLGDARDEICARNAAAQGLAGSSREAMLASASMVETRVEIDRPVRLLSGTSPAVRLTNLELGPPGCDPRRRASVLEQLNGALGDDAALDAIALSGWAHFAGKDFEAARSAFERVVASRPSELAAWEGLRATAEKTNDRSSRARAAAELGARCVDARRGAAFLEEAAILWLSLGDGEAADRWFDASFSRDPKRAVAFDKLFRRTRDRKDNDKLLTIIARRLEVTDEPNEIQKLFWEQARVLRESGDQDGALKALEHVTLLDPDHIGALALLGEINIRRGQFEDAAEALARLAALESAPPKNRITAGVAAADLYENKLRRIDKALDVLRLLERAHISTVPVRERLAKTAARAGAWQTATEALERLMIERPDPSGRIEAARLALVIHRDRLGDVQRAAAAIVKLLEESPADGEALDALLCTEHAPEIRGRLIEEAKSTIIARLQSDPTDAESVLRVVALAGALGDDALRQAALGALAALGGSDATSEQTFAAIASHKPRAPQVAFPSQTLRSALAPGDDGRIADLFSLLGPTLADAIGPNLAACGVGRRDRIDPRSGLALRNEIASWVGAFGIRDFDLYVGGKDPLGVQGVPGEPPALVIGAGVNAPLAPLTRARVGRELLGIVRGTTMVRWRDDVTVASVVVVACRLADVHIEHPPYTVLAEIDRLIAKAISRRTRRLLPDVCAAIVAEGLDPRAWIPCALASQDRLAAIASGDPCVVLCDVLGVPMDRLEEAVHSSARAKDLLRFVLSPTYLDIRRSVGLEEGAR